MIYLCCQKLLAFASLSQLELRYNCLTKTISSSYQPMLDVPIYGRIATLELFRPHVSTIIFIFKIQKLVILWVFGFIHVFLSEQGETQDLLFIATERYKFCVLQWDAETSELITRFKHDINWSKINFVTFTFGKLRILVFNFLQLNEPSFSSIRHASCMLCEFSFMQSYIVTQLYVFYKWL